MNTATKNDMLTAIGILVLVIGTATGNAYVMFAMALIALAAMTIMGRNVFGWRAWFGVTVAAATAAAVAFGIARF